MKQYVLSADLIQQIMNYLGNRPYHEVYKLVGDIGVELAKQPTSVAPPVEADNVSSEK